MFFPEGLFLLSERDAKVTWLDPLLDEQSAAVAAASVTIQLPRVPIDRVLVLQSASAQANAGAAQTVTQLAIHILPESAGATRRLAGVYPAAPTNQVLDWSGSVIVPSGWFVQAVGVFNAGAAANTVRLAVHGMLLPNGNIQRL